MNPAQRDEVLQLRKQCKLPWHTPPHVGKETRLYHITAACYEHAHILHSPERLTQFETQLIGGLNDSGVAHTRAWCILPNHYHLLLKTELPAFKTWIHRLHNSTATNWNGEDKARGRKVWHAFSDRYIRGDIHYFRSLNYIHANPVKHGFVDSSNEWPWSSLEQFTAHYGRETLVRWWQDYPVTGYGTGWDD